ncbi:hypothetical protein BASA50_006288 [Batrachochytrium salamandrivorans]|uniref:WD repeat-containing protein 63 n=1 Tax=Batrachochytrium salamandrivorans TaxID=1357716 RepID=A0ABQ8FAA6_9FUNG|nr:hypothetical protein BASA50_006288 [Batrachochytrium salamandrivorans]
MDNTVLANSRADVRSNKPTPSTRAASKAKLTQSRVGSKGGLNKAESRTASAMNMGKQKTTSRVGLGSIMDGVAESTDTLHQVQPQLSSGPLKRGAISSRTNLANSSESRSNLISPTTGISHHHPHSDIPAMMTIAQHTDQKVTDVVSQANSVYHAEGLLEGALPLFLTSMTQGIFKIKAGEDMTEKVMFKVIPKSEILSDIQSFPRDEILVHYDPKFKYGQNFFICITCDAMDSILHPIIQEVPQQAPEVKSVLERVRQWKSLGSDLEIEMDQIRKNRELVSVNVSRKGCEYKNLYTFGDRDAHEEFLECRPYRDANYEVTRMEIHTAVQAIPEVVSKHAQTTWFRSVNFACQYEPAEMTKEDQQEILGSESIEGFLQSLFGDEDMTLDQSSQTILQEYQSFTDLINSKDRSISCIDWHPQQKGVIAISCTQRISFEDCVEMGLTLRARKSLIIVWSFHDPIHPQLVLEAPEDVHTFCFNPIDSNIVVGGCANGQIVLWDLNIHWLPHNFELSSNGGLVENGENGHKQLVSSSLDGTVSFWDLRYKKDWKSLDLAWRPFLRIPISSFDNMFDYSLIKVSIRPFITAAPKPASADIPLRDPPSSADREREKDKSKTPPLKNWTSKFYCATEEGDLVYADWIAEKTTEEKVSRVESTFSTHHGPISDLQRSPFFPDILLSVGGWSFSIWKEKLIFGPLLSSVPASSYLLSGCWSPTRPGVFFIGRADGVLEVWDLLDTSHAPSTTQTITSTAISCLQIHQYGGRSGDGQQFLAVGDDSGTLHIIEIPKKLQRPSKNEKSVITSLFEREARRATYTHERKQVRAKDRAKFESSALETPSAVKSSAAGVEIQGSAQQKTDTGSAPATGTDILTADDEEEKAEQAFLKLELDFLDANGLLSPSVTSI